MQSLLNIKTPYYLYDTDLLHSNLSFVSSIAGSFGFHIHYALKANNNPGITQIISRYGLGADCVSGYEISEALYRNFPAKKIVYAGVGKTDDEIRLALQNNILCLNCESIEELQVIEQIASSMQKTAPVAIRVNPDIEPYTHKYITTGKEENKFGLHLNHLKQALEFINNSTSLKFMGLHFHIGSQITTIEPFAKLCKKVNSIWRIFELDSYGGCLLNLGGGLGIDYSSEDNAANPGFKEYFSLFHNKLDIPSHVNIHFELGRSIVASCGKLITRVLYTKEGISKNFVIVDAGMTELMRPALYNAQHRIENLTSPGMQAIYDVAGPICESSDVFAKNIKLPKTARGDLLAIHSCGAYGESMMLSYNMRPKVKSWFVSNGVIARGQSGVESEPERVFA